MSKNKEVSICRSYQYEEEKYNVESIAVDTLEGLLRQYHKEQEKKIELHEEKLKSEKAKVEEDNTLEEEGVSEEEE